MLSIAIPVLSERELLETAIPKVITVAEKLMMPFEIVIVSDGDGCKASEKHHDEICVPAEVINDNNSFIKLWEHLPESCQMPCDGAAAVSAACHHERYGNEDQRYAESLASCHSLIEEQHSHNHSGNGLDSSKYGSGC